MVSAIDKMTLVKQASASLANATSAQRTEALLNISKLLLQRSDEIIAAKLEAQNFIDLLRLGSDE